MLMHAALRCPEYTLSTDILPMEIYYSVWMYNQIPDMNYVLSSIDIWSMSRFDPIINPYQLSCLGFSNIFFRTKVVKAWSEDS